MIKNLIILALITINLVFLWAFIQRAPDRPPLPQANTQSSAPPAKPTPTHSNNTENTALSLMPEIGSDYATTIDQLRAAGMDEATLRQMMLATINRDHLTARSNDQSSPYWRPDEVGSEDKLNADLDWELERREQLIALFGLEIVDDPLFVDIFKPLNGTLSFLSSDKQIMLDELRRRDDAKTQALFRGGFTQESRSDLMEQREDLQRRISELLGADDNFEYQLRESRLAERMRRGLGSFDYSESEFRDIFTIRQTNEGNELSSRFNSRQEFREQREQSESAIQDYLGDNRYEEYARSQDPAYRSLQSIGERYGNTTAEINDVYEVTRNTQEQISALREGNTLSRDERVERMNEIRSQAFEEIEQIAGKETADPVRENAGRLGFRRGFSSRVLP